MAVRVSLLENNYASDQEGSLIEHALNFVRTHLHMDVAYLSEFVPEGIAFRVVDAPGFEELLQVGKTMPLDQIYCRHVAEGRLPEMISDTREHPVAQDIPVTRSLPIGAHISVPMIRSDGSIYGMFCCLSRDAQPDLNARDLQVFKAFAALAAEHLNINLDILKQKREIREKIQDVLDQSKYDVHYQPIYDTENDELRSFEALCRFHGEPYRSPDKWFKDAEEVGLQEELELHVAQTALLALHTLPGYVSVSVNFSPGTIQSGRIWSICKNYDPARIVLELTEHVDLENYEDLCDEIDALRFRGVRLAIDDAGSGYSGLKQILKLRPDIIKLDRALTTNIDRDAAKAALGAAMVRYGLDTKTKIVAEGIENIDELNTVRKLGISFGQGYFLGRPTGFEQALEVAHSRLRIAG